MAEKKVEKVIPRKNYIIFIIVFLVTIFAAVYIIQFYKNYKEIHSSESIVMKYINNQLNYEELDAYILENDAAIIYMGISSDELCRKFEQNFKKEVSKRGLQDKIIYIDLSNLKNSDANYISLINDKYNKGITDDLKRVPAILIFKDKVLVDMVFASSDELNPNDVVDLLKDHEMLD